MIRPLVKKAFGWSLRWLPVQTRDRLLTHLVERCSDGAKFRLGFPTVGGLLAHLAPCFRPGTIVDIGAYVGEWSLRAGAIFHEARFVMIDGNPENETALQDARRSLGNRAEYVIALLGPDTRDEVVFYQMASGSSLLPEMTTVARRELSLPMRTLDTVCADHVGDSPFLLKLDVQGFELELLKGGPKTLERAEVVILETSVLPYNDGAPSFTDVVLFMEQSGFAVYDFCGQFRRQTDQTLFQTDVVFVRHDSDLRARRAFWLNEP